MTKCKGCTHTHWTEKRRKSNTADKRKSITKNEWTFCWKHRKWSSASPTRRKSVSSDHLLWTSTGVWIRLQEEGRRKTADWNVGPTDKPSGEDQKDEEEGKQIKLRSTHLLFNRPAFNLTNTFSCKRWLWWTLLIDWLIGYRTTSDRNHLCWPRFISSSLPINKCKAFIFLQEIANNYTKILPARFRSNCSAEWLRWRWTFASCHPHSNSKGQPGGLSRFERLRMWTVKSRRRTVERRGTEESKVDMKNLWMILEMNGWMTMMNDDQVWWSFGSSSRWMRVWKGRKWKMKENRSIAKQRGAKWQRESKVWRTRCGLFDWKMFLVEDWMSARTKKKQRKMSKEKNRRLKGTSVGCWWSKRNTKLYQPVVVVHQRNRMKNETIVRMKRGRMMNFDL